VPARARHPESNCWATYTKPPPEEPDHPFPVAGSLTARGRDDDAIASKLVDLIRETPPAERDSAVSAFIASLCTALQPA